MGTFCIGILREVNKLRSKAALPGGTEEIVDSADSAAAAQPQEIHLRMLVTSTKS